MKDVRDPNFVIDLSSAEGFVDPRIGEFLPRSYSIRLNNVLEIVMLPHLANAPWPPARHVRTRAHMLPSHNPATAVRNALSLGRTAGRILAAAAAAGTLLPYVRPEYMWAREVDGTLEVTGLSARGHAFFAKTTIDAVSLPLFDRYYYAPEAYDDPDARSLVFALAIMIAEWATGRFPFKYKFHDQGPLEGKHLKLKLPARLASLLSQGMRLDRSERPGLLLFLDELERCER